MQINVENNFCFSSKKQAMSDPCFPDERLSRSFLMQRTKRVATEICTFIEEENAKKATDSKRGVKDYTQKGAGGKRPREDLLQFSSIHNTFKSSMAAQPWVPHCLRLLERSSIFPGADRRGLSRGSLELPLEAGEHKPGQKIHITVN